MWFKEQSKNLPQDIKSFQNILQKKYNIFLERRKIYNNHLNNSQRFPKEYECGLYIKCCRFIRDFENGIYNEDTIIDMSNYADLILSIKEHE